jgi:hypothetical protein
VVVLVADFESTSAAHEVFERDDVSLEDALRAPDLPGPTYGICEQVEGRSWCREYWQLGGFVVGTYIGGPGVGRSDTNRVLAFLVPVVVDNLAQHADRPPIRTHGVGERSATMPSVERRQVDARP